MSAVILDTGPLGILANPNSTPKPTACRAWAAAVRAAGRRVIVPEIADFELRRELLRTNLVYSLGLLDGLAVTFEYLPLTSPVMRHAAELWAKARNAGLATAANQHLDCDVILAAQALLLGEPVIVATTNVKHLARFVPAERWENIVP